MGGQEQTDYVFGFNVVAKNIIGLLGLGNSEAKVARGKGKNLKTVHLPRCYFGRFLAAARSPVGRNEFKFPGFVPLEKMSGGIVANGLRLKTGRLES